MSKLLKRSLIRSGLMIVTIVGALFVVGVIFNVQEGTARVWHILLATFVVVALVLMNRWWYRQTGSRI